jgi:hypothetical protein
MAWYLQATLAAPEQQTAHSDGTNTVQYGSSLQHNLNLTTGTVTRKYTTTAETPPAHHLGYAATGNTVLLHGVVAVPTCIVPGRTAAAAAAAADRVL